MPDQEDIDILEGNEEGNDEEEKKVIGDPNDNKDDEDLEDEDKEEDNLEEDKEDEDDEEGDDDKDEDDEEEDDVVSRPKLSDIKKEFPEIFTKFPDLKDAYTKYSQYERLFPTIDDAKEAYSDNEAYLNLRESVLSGNPELLLTGLKSTDQESYTLFTRKILPVLFEKDKDLYTEVVTPVVEGLLRSAYKEAKKHNNENLENATLELAEHIFGDDELLTKNKTFTKPLKEQKNEELQQRETSSYNNARNECAESIKKSFKTEIRRGLDPDNELAPFIRNSIIDSVINDINKQLGSDNKFQGTQSARWGVAKRKGYDESSKRQIVNAALSRARLMIPSLREKYKTAALGTNKNSNNKRRDSINRNIPYKKELTGGRRDQRRGKLDASKVDFSKTSDLDLFEDRISYKN